ncbi:MAG: tetratricopeptide repeat protein, partial [Candidatus Latescibacteria bacterium]|nr:tetratricopeptide repeat protein [Candidatus Latescibacterota bacterium]
IDVHYDLGKLYVQNRMYTDAVSAFRKVVDLDSTFVPVYDDLGEIYSKAKRYNDAVFYLMKSASLKPDDPTTNLRLSKALYFSGRREEALPYLEKAALLHTDDGEIHTLLGDALVQHGAYEKAVQAYTMALEGLHEDNNLPGTTHRTRHGDNETEQVHLRYKLAKARLAIKDTAMAIADMKHIVSLDSSTSDATSDLGILLYQTGRYDEAVPRLAKRLEGDPAVAQAYLDLGRCYLRAGRPDRLNDLRETLDGVIEQYPALNTVYYTLGIDLFKEKRYDLAIPFLSKKAEIDPTHWATHVNLGLVYIAKADYPKAVHALRQAARLKPDHAQTSLWLAQVYGQMNDIVSAKSAYQKVVALEGDDKEMLQEAHRQIGYYLLLEKQYDEAITSLQKAVRLKPSDPQAHLWLAQGLALSGQIEKAKTEYHEVLRLDKGNEDAKIGLKRLEGD